MDARELLLAYVDAHNVGVRTGDWEELVALLDRACEMRFRSGRAGPFRGREAVVRAFRDDPPGAELHIAQVTAQVKEEVTAQVKEEVTVEVKEEATVEVTAEVTKDADRAQALYGWVGGWVGADARFSGTLRVDGGPSGIRRVFIDDLGRAAGQERP